MRQKQGLNEVYNGKNVTFFEAGTTVGRMNVLYGGLRSIPRKRLPHSCSTVIKVGRESILRGLWLRILKLHGEDEGSPRSLHHSPES